MAGIPQWFKTEVLRRLTGVRAGNTALASLLSALAGLGLIVDGSTA